MYLAWLQEFLKEKKTESQRFNDHTQWCLATLQD